MRYFLDTNVIIYAVEGQPLLQQRARNHIAAWNWPGIILPLASSRGPNVWFTP